jgi:hypothetical protein
MDGRSEGGTTAAGNMGSENDDGSMRMTETEGEKDKGKAKTHRTKKAKE